MVNVYSSEVWSPCGDYLAYRVRCKGYGPPVTRDEAGRESSSDPEWMAFLRTSQERWHRQIWALRLGAWMGDRAQGAAAADGAITFRSALSRPSSESGMTPAGSTTGSTEHALVASTREIGDGSDVWTRNVLCRDFTFTSSIEVVFPRSGDPRSIGQSIVVDKAVSAGAAVRIKQTRQAVSSAGADDSITILIPEDLHENLLTWSQFEERTDTSRTFDVGSVADADRHLRHLIVQTESVLSDLGLRPSFRRARSILDDTTRMLTEPPFLQTMKARHRDTVLRAAPLLWMCDLALNDDSVVVSRHDHATRTTALRELDRAARYALEAATSWPAR